MWLFRRLLGIAVVHKLLSQLAQAGLLEQIVGRFPASLLAPASLYWGNPGPVLKRYRQLLNGTAHPNQAVRIAAELRLHGYVEEAQCLIEAYPEGPRAARERATIVANRYTPSAAEFLHLMGDRSSRDYVPKGRRDSYVVQRALPDHLHRRSGPEPNLWDSRSSSEVCELTLEAFDVLHSKRRPSPGDLIRHGLLLRQTLMDSRTEPIQGFVSSRSLLFFQRSLGAEKFGGVATAASSGSAVALKAELAEVDERRIEALAYGSATALYTIAMSFGLFTQALRIRGALIRRAAEGSNSAPSLHSAWARILAGTEPDSTVVARLLRKTRSGRDVSAVADMAALAEDRSLLELCRSNWRFPDESELQRSAGCRPVLVHGPIEPCADLPVATSEDPFLVLIGDYEAPKLFRDVPVGLRIVTKELISYRPESVKRLSGTPLRGIHTITSLGVSGVAYLKGWPYGLGNALQRAAALALRAGIGPIAIGGGTLFLALNQTSDYRRSVGTASDGGDKALAALRALTLPVHDPFFQFDYLRRGLKVGAFSVDSRLETILNAGIEDYAGALERQFC